MTNDPSPSQPDAETPDKAGVTSTAEFFRVAVFAHMTDPDVLPDLLVEIVHLHHLDAAVAARSTPGILPISLTQPQADQLVAQLQENGFSAIAAPMKSIPDLTHATVLHHARPLESGLEILDLHGNPCELRPWSELGVIAVGSVPAETTSRYIEQGRPAVLSAAPIPEVSRVEVPERNSLELWCLTRDGHTAYRLRHNRFNYECLGSDMTESATVNFDRFLRRLVAAASGVRQTPSTHAFLAHELAKYQFDSVDQLQQQLILSWIMQRQS